MCNHYEDDYNGFKSVISEYCAGGVITQAEDARAFGVTPNSIKRAVKLYLKAGRRGFFTPRRTRGAAVLTAPMLLRAQELLDQGLALADVSDQLGLKRNTASKALRSEMGDSAFQPKPCPRALQRHPSLVPKAIAALKMATDTFGRVAAGSTGRGSYQLSAGAGFSQRWRAASPAGPSGDGLAERTHFKLPTSYYGLTSIFLVWGKLLGLDRVPEVRTMRSKVKQLAENGNAAQSMQGLDERIPRAIHGLPGRRARACLPQIQGSAPGSMRWMASHFSWSTRRPTPV